MPTQPPTRESRRISWPLAVAIALLTAGATTAQPEVMSAEAFAAERAAPTFQLRGDQLSPADLLELTFQCLGTGAQTDGENLIVYGFSQVDARAYQLQGPRALETALRRAELGAQGQAVAFFNAVLIEVRNSNEVVATDTAQGSISDTDAGSSFVSQFSTQTRSTLATFQQSQVRGYLVGGRTTGTKLISLGESGMCVGVRYEAPLDQHGFDPVERARSESTQSPAAPEQPAIAPSRGFAPPPAGSIGDF